MIPGEEEDLAAAAGWRTADLSAGLEQLINSQMTASVRRAGGGGGSAGTKHWVMRKKTLGTMKWIR